MKRNSGLLHPPPLRTAVGPPTVASPSVGKVRAVVLSRTSVVLIGDVARAVHRARRVLLCTGDFDGWCMKGGHFGGLVHVGCKHNFEDGIPQVGRRDVH